MNDISMLSKHVNARAEVLEAFEEKPNQPFVRMKFELLFLKDNKVLHKVDVSKINFLDLRRHLEHGESVQIIPKSAEVKLSPSFHDQKPWYFIHV